MKNRIIFGFIAACLLVALVSWGHPYLLLVSISVLSALSFWEFDRLFFPERSTFRLVAMTGAIISTLILMDVSLIFGTIATWITFVGIGVCHVFRSNRYGDFYKITREMALLITGYFYLVGLFGFLVPLATLNHGRAYAFLFFFIVFVGDTAAYFAGLAFGKRRLATLLSPKKSIEGSVAAVLSSFVVAGVWLYFEPKDGTDSAYALKVILFAPVVSGLAQLGDLFESMFKRSQMQKDSGVFLPGHGGVLDRVDGLALAAPIFFFFVRFVLSPGEGGW